MLSVYTWRTSARFKLVRTGSGHDCVALYCNWSIALVRGYHADLFVYWKMYSSRVHVSFTSSLGLIRYLIKYDTIDYYYGKYSAVFLISVKCGCLGGISGMSLLEAVLRG
jgi:hypothetical protein